MPTLRKCERVGKTKHEFLHCNLIQFIQIMLRNIQVSLFSFCNRDYESYNSTVKTFALVSGQQVIFYYEFASKHLCLIVHKFDRSMSFRFLSYIDIIATSYLHCLSHNALKLPSQQQRGNERHKFVYVCSYSSHLICHAHLH